MANRYHVLIGSQAVGAQPGRQLPAWNQFCQIGVDRHLNEVERSTMDWNRVEGNWKQVKGKVKEQWGRLTDDDLDVIAGRRDQLEGKLQERYGTAKDQLRKDIDDWYNAQKW
jgi:uncharacterized protein YjbJ (UPF0337 family)